MATKDALKKEIQIDEITPNPKVILEQKRTHPERDAESHEFFLSGMEIHEPNPKCPIKLSYGLDGEIESVPSNNLCIPRSLMIGLNKSPFGSIEYPNNNSNIAVPEKGRCVDRGQSQNQERGGALIGGSL